MYVCMYVCMYIYVYMYTHNMIIIIGVRRCRRPGEGWSDSRETRRKGKYSYIYTYNYMYRMYNHIFCICIVAASTNREFTKGGLVKGGLAIGHVFNLHIQNRT